MYKINSDSDADAVVNLDINPISEICIRTSSYCTLNSFFTKDSLYQNEESINPSSNEEHNSVTTNKINNERLEISANNMIPIQSNSEDESMAVEALRQLGGMYSAGVSTEDSLPMLSCDNCESKFLTTAELNTHMVSCKYFLKKNIEKCLYCFTIFDNLENFNNHNCSSLAKLTCNYCGNNFDTNIELIKHIKLIHKLSSLTNHLKINNHQSGKALFINSKYTNSKTTDHDYILSNSTVTLNSTSSRNCLKNLEESENILDESNDISNNKKEIDESTIVITHIEEIETEVINKEDNPNKKPYLCSQCEMSFSREKALKNHLNLHNINWQSSHVCELCNKTFADLNLKLDHTKTCTDSANLNLIEQKSRKIKPTPYHDELNSAKSKLIGKHICTVCRKRFTTKQKLFRHMWVHRKKTFNCELCSHIFETQTDLDKHRFSKHPSNSPHSCKECGKIFASRQGLWEHNKIHSKKGKLYTCEQCSKIFSSRQGYMIHQRAHSGQRPYSCQYCIKAFRDNGTLRKHERIHTGERPHICPICKSDFTQKVVLREHIRCVHVATKVVNKNGSFSCMVCGICVADREELSAHIMKHSDQMLVKRSKSNQQLMKKARKDSSLKPVENIKN